MNYRIGIDGGGTTTRAVVVDAERRVLGRGEADSSNYFNVGLSAMAAHVGQAIDCALRAAGIKGDAIEGIGVALAGVVSAHEQGVVAGTLEPLFAGRAWAVDEDAAAAQSGAFGGAAGAILIAGTGANCFGINARGERARADGWGPLLGDRGSGYNIGETALRAVVAAHDGTAPPTALSQPVLAAFEVESVSELVPVVYAPDFRRDRIAALVPLVLQGAAAGDAVALELLQAAGRALAATAATVLGRLGECALAPTGGVIARASPVRSAFEASLRERVPAVVISEPLYDAAIGAALLVKC
jgi:N-acetylglucosamine kinase